MMTDPTPLTIGTALPPLTVSLTRADLVRYAGASTDFNPIHWSDRMARRVGMPSVIAHGMLTMATALRVVTEWVGDPAKVRSYSCRFTSPVPVPDDEVGTELRISATVTGVTDETATVTISAVITGPDGEDVKVLGQAVAEVDRG
ncbi:MaoC/PaaZ C-terminal domain-containing protein [Raineyella fluvialis]